MWQHRDAVATGFDDKALVTHAVLFPAENVIKVAAVVGAVGIVAAKATPHVKNRFNDLKSKLNRKSGDAVEATTP